MTPQQTLARKLAAAWASYKLRIGLEYAYKTHTSADDIGELWLGLADEILKLDAQALSEMVSRAREVTT
jgi:hypothetical protein